jgi:hypothetical protein
MKKLIIGCVALMLFIGTGCNEQLFRQVLTVNKDMTFAIDHTGAFADNGTITAASIEDALNLPERSRVVDVFIETIKLSVSVKSGNVASTVKVSGSLQGGDALFVDQNIDLTDPEVLDESWFGFTVLNEDGIEDLKTRLSEIIEGTNIADLNFSFTGNSVPGGQKIQIDVRLRVVATVLYEACFEVPPFMGSQDCGDL